MTLHDEAEHVEEEFTGHPVPHPDEMAPIQVIVTNSEKTAPADLSSWSTYVLKGDGSDLPFPLLPQDRKRHCANVLVNGTAGDYVLLGKQNQVSNKQGGRVYVGNTVRVESASQVMCIPVATVSANPIVITVEDERYA